MKYLTGLIACLLLAAQAAADCNDEADRALRNGEVGESIRILTDCLESDLSNIARTWFLLGQARGEQGRGGDAIDSYSRAIDLTADESLRARAALARGELRRKRRDRDGAESDFTLAIGADPGFADAYYARARLLHRRGDEDSALADYTRVIDLDGTNAHALFYRAAIYRKKGLEKLAIADYERAIELNPNFVRAHADRAFTFLFPLLPVLFVLILG